MEVVIRRIFHWINILVEFGERIVYYMSSSVDDLVDHALGDGVVGGIIQSVLDFLNIGNSTLFEWIFTGGIALIILASIVSFFSKII